MILDKFKNKTSEVSETSEVFQIYNYEISPPINRGRNDNSYFLIKQLSLLFI